MAQAWPWLKRVLVVVGIVAAVAVAWFAWNRGLVTKWKEDARPLPFFAGMAIVPALGVPITPLFVLAGATFGRRVGLIGSGLALATNLGLCYWVARSGLRPWLVRLLGRFDYELPDYEQKYKGAWRFALVVKVAPGIPQFVKNYALGVAGIPFPLYFGISMLVTGVYGALLIVLGESLFAHDLRRTVLVGAVVLALAAGIWWWRRRRSAVSEGPEPPQQHRRAGEERDIGEAAPHH
jgi:uncharacterized membrane protein YdjX (TVP38/TMEM64 family)